MTSSTMIFLLGLAFTVAISVGAAIYLRSALQAILNELCGTRDRAAFWTAFSNVAITLVPLIFAMQYGPERGTQTVLELVTQLKWGLIGLIATVVVLGFVLSRFIPRANRPAEVAKPAESTR